MNRRHFILASASAGIFLTGSTAWLSIEGNNEPLSIDFALTKLAALMQQQPMATGNWKLNQIFNHCAQSVEYSMLGYPQHKSELFKKTAGKAAFSLFNAKGKMSHPLDEAIPGAPELGAGADTLQAYQRLRQSLLDFKHYSAELAPHFAYGHLSKSEYEAAHVMHFNNHLQEVLLTKTSA